MRSVKGLFLGGAAGLVAVGAAQAADLPVKAKAVEYVKVCSLYGAGFYYMPGSDICLKLGGFVRYQFNVGPGNNVSFGPFFGTGGALLLVMRAILDDEVGPDAGVRHCEGVLRMLGLTGDDVADIARRANEAVAG